MVQHLIHFLCRLASVNKDYAVVMCRLGTKDVLVKSLDKHGTNLLLLPELRDVVVDCDKYASLYKKMTTSVLAGCIQVPPPPPPPGRRRRERWGRGLEGAGTRGVTRYYPFPIRWCWVRLRSTAAATSQSTFPSLTSSSGTSVKVRLLLFFLALHPGSSSSSLPSTQAPPHDLAPPYSLLVLYIFPSSALDSLSSSLLLLKLFLLPFPPSFTISSSERLFQAPLLYLSFFTFSYPLLRPCLLYPPANPEASTQGTS